MLVACAIAFANGCFLFQGPGGAPLRASSPPLGPAPARSAVLVIAYPRIASSADATHLVGPATPDVDVIDERGELLARLSQGSWTTLSRPPGLQRFAVVPSWGPSACAGIDAGVGTLAADLVPGRYAYVAVLARQLSLGPILSAGCCGYGGLWIDLARVPMFGEVRAAADLVLASGRLLEPVPRGLMLPAGPEVLERAARRQSAACFDPDASRIDAADQSELPPYAFDP